jgi:hypothetical protein
MRFAQLPAHKIGDQAQEGFSSPVTLRRRRRAHWLYEWQQDMVHHLGAQRIGSLRARLAETPQLAGQSGLLRRLGRARPTGRPGVGGDLIQQAQRAQQVRPPVPALPVLPHEVRRAGN